MLLATCFMKLISRYTIIVLQPNVPYIQRTELITQSINQSDFYLNILFRKSTVKHKPKTVNGDVTVPKHMEFFK